MNNAIKVTLVVLLIFALLVAAVVLFANGPAKSSETPTHSAASLTTAAQGRHELPSLFGGSLLHDPKRPRSLEPAQASNGEPALRVVRLRQGSALARLGLQEGDLVLSVNGFPASDGTATLFAKLKGATEFRFVLERARKQLEVSGKLN